MNEKANFWNMIARFMGGFIGLLVLGLLSVSGIGIWADQVPGARPEMVSLMILLVSFAAMLTATAMFIVGRVEEMLSTIRAR